MADGASLEVHGGPELRRALKTLGADLKDLSALHKEIAAMIVPVVQAEAPVGPTGRLSKSFKPSGTRTKARVRSTLVYAAVIHYGWRRRNISPNHFGDRARDKSQAKIMSAYRDGIDKLLKKAER